MGVKRTKDPFPQKSRNYRGICTLGKESGLLVVKLQLLQPENIFGLSYRLGTTLMVNHTTNLPSLGANQLAIEFLDHTHELSDEWQATIT